MESIRLMTEYAWAMGLTAKVAVNDAVPDFHQRSGDRFLYPEQWTLGPITGSEDEFVAKCLNNPKHSYALTKKTLVVI
jgi:hypothetical protein